VSFFEKLSLGMGAHFPQLRSAIIEAVFVSSKSTRSTSTNTTNSSRSSVRMAINKHHSIGVTLDLSETVAITFAAVQALILQHVITDVTDSTVRLGVRTE